MEETYLLAMRCPVYRRRDSNPGFRTELENLAGDGKGKGTSGRTVRPKVPMRKPGADCSVVARKRGNARGAKGAGHLRRDRYGSTGNRRNSGIVTLIVLSRKGPHAIRELVESLDPAPPEEVLNAARRLKYRDSLSGGRTRGFPYIECVFPKSFERESIA